MRIIDIISISLKQIISKRLNSLLLIIGITVGITITSLIIAAGETGRIIIKKFVPVNIENIVQVRTKKQLIFYSDYEEIKKHCPNIQYIHLRTTFGYYKIKTETFSREELINGLTIEDLKILNFTPIYGRLFTQSDFDNAALVCIIGDEIKKMYFPYENPIGKTLFIKNIEFKIIGVLPKLPQFHFVYNYGVSIPLSTAVKLLLNLPLSLWKTSNFHFLAKEGKLEEALAEIKSFIRLKYGDENQFEFLPWKEEIKEIYKEATRYFLIFFIIGSLALTCAYLNLINIMITRVAQRKIEIGIRRACGANKFHIIIQFLTEVIILGVIGAIAGLIITYFCITAMEPYKTETYYSEYFQLTFDWVVIIFTMITSIIVSIAAGLYPALKAAKVSPVEVLRPR